MVLSGNRGSFESIVFVWVATLNVRGHGSTNLKTADILFNQVHILQGHLPMK